MKRIISVLITGAVLLGAVPAMAAEQPIINNDFESGELGFSVRGTAAAAISTDTAHSGTSSMLVSGRGANGWEGVNISIMNDIKLDETYYGQMYVKAATPGESFTVKMSVDLEDESGSDYPQIGSAKVNSSEWTLIEGTWTVDYQGNLKSMNLDLETDEDGIGKSFYVDDVFFAHESVSKPQPLPVQPVEQAKVTYSGIELPSDVEDTEYAEDVEKMMALGVVEGYPDGTFGPENKVTRAEFLTMLLRLLNVNMPESTVSSYTDVPTDHFACSAIEWATSSGICSGYGDGLFGPDDNVTYAQAVKMLISTMGYSYRAEQNGGYPNGYITVANAEDIAVKGITDSGIELTRAMTAELMGTALDVPLYLRTYNGITRDENASILSEYYDGGLIKGYIESSNDVSVNETNAGIGIITIDGEEYRVGTTRAAELVGYYVELIYEGDGDDKNILYIAPIESRNEELELDAKEIESYSDNTYEYYENDRLRKARVEKDFTLVYNGRTVTDGFDESMMLPELGTVKLVGTNSGDYEMVYITSYETMIVSSVNRNTTTVYDVNNNKFSFEDGEIPDLTFIKPDGSEGSFSDITSDDVLHIAASADGEKAVVHIVRSSVEGQINSISDETITIDGNEYELSQAYINRNYTMPKVSTTVTAYLDFNGDVVYMDEGGDTGMEVGYLLRAYEEEGGEDITIKYIDSKGSAQTSELRAKVNIDGAQYEDPDAKLAAINGNTEDGSAEKRIFRYSVNGSGEVIRLDFARAQAECLTEAERGEGAQSLHVVNSSYYANDGMSSDSDDASLVKYTYKYNARTFIDENGTYSSIALNPNTVIFKVPSDGSSDVNDYEITNVSSLGYDEQYKVFAYKTGTDGLTVDFAVLFTDVGGAENIRSQEGYVVTNVTEALNRNEEAVQCVEVYINGERRSYIIKEEEVWDEAVASNNNNPIERGDIVRFDTDSYGEISNLTVDKGSGKYDDYFYSAQGYIYLKDDGYAYFTTKRPTDSMSYDDMLLIPIDDFSITVYDVRRDEVHEGVSGEIIDYMTDPENYSSVYITMNYETPKTLICVIDE